MDTDLELATLDSGDGIWDYSVGSTGQLLALTQGPRASSILRFQVKSDVHFNHVFPVVFRKESDRYIVTR